jgi:hypothetical protein
MQEYKNDNRKVLTSISLLLCHAIQAKLALEKSAALTLTTRVSQLQKHLADTTLDLHLMKSGQLKSGQLVVGNPPWEEQEQQEEEEGEQGQDGQQQQQEQQEQEENLQEEADQQQAQEEGGADTRCSGNSLSIGLISSASSSSSRYKNSWHQRHNSRAKSSSSSSLGIHSKGGSTRRMELVPSPSAAHMKLITL